MSTRLTEGLPIGIVVEGEGIEFAVEWTRNASGRNVEVTVECPDHSGYRAATQEVYFTIPADDWDNIVDFIEAQRGPREYTRCGSCGGLGVTFPLGPTTGENPPCESCGGKGRHFA